MPIQIDQHDQRDKHNEQGGDGPDKRAERRLLWIGISIGIGLLAAAGLWILAILASSGALGIAGSGADILIGAAVTVTILAGQVVLDYRRQAQAAATYLDIGLHHGKVRERLDGIDARQDELARVVGELSGAVARQHRETLSVVQGIADEAVARAAVRDLTEKIDAGPPDTPTVTPIRPRSGSANNT